MIPTDAREYVLRMDDPGASTKHYEQYAKLPWKIAGHRLPTPFFCNWGPLKRLPSIKGWGPYEELSVQAWQDVFSTLQKHGAGLTVSVTAAWADSATDLTPFDKKFPAQASILREGVQAGLIEIANHGLTHCVLEGNQFLPQPFAGNRKYHREFWPSIPITVQREHILQSQEILTRTFKTDIVTFVPPGNVWSENIEDIMKQAGIRYLCADERRAPTGTISHGLTYIGTGCTLEFHDREIALFGIPWLNDQLATHAGRAKMVKDYAAQL